MAQAIRIVLVETSHPGNIGAAARAMKNMGIGELWLVAPTSFPDEVATARASGADDILGAARVVDDLDTAIADPVSASHNRNVASDAPVAIRFPSGLSALT